MTIVEIPPGSGNRYRYEYNPETGNMEYRGPVGDSPELREDEFLKELSECDNLVCQKKWERDEIWLLPIDERVPLMKIHERGGISKYREGQIGELGTLQCLVGRGLLTLQKGDDYLDNIYTLTDGGRAMVERNPYSEDELQTYDKYFHIRLGLWRDTIDDPMLPNVAGDIRLLAYRRPATWEDLNLQCIRTDSPVLLKNETYWKEILKVIGNGVRETRGVTIEDIEKKNKELKELNMEFLGIFPFETQGRKGKISEGDVRKRLGL